MNWEEWKWSIGAVCVCVCVSCARNSDNYIPLLEHPSNFTDPRFHSPVRDPNEYDAIVTNTSNNIRKFCYVLFVTRLLVNSVRLYQQNGSNDDYSKFHKRINVNQGVWYTGSLFNRASSKRNYFYRAKRSYKCFQETIIAILCSLFCFNLIAHARNYVYRQQKYFSNCSH